MGKLGKKARKFAKKNLQSVYKRNRKINSMINKKKFASKNKRNTAEDKAEIVKDRSDERKSEDIKETCLDTIFDKDVNALVEYDSDSDGYLSEDLNFPDMVETESENDGEETAKSALMIRNREISLELAEKNKKLAKLKKKDPKFLKFVETHSKSLEALGNDETFTDDEASVDANHNKNKDRTKVNKVKMLKISTINSWCLLVKEQNSLPALTSLINGFRAACHYGVDSADVIDDIIHPRIQNSEAFCNIVTFMLHEGDGIFRGLLGISGSSCKKEIVLDLKNTAKWKAAKPLIKSYLRSILFLLNQVTDVELLTMCLSRLGASLMFFAAFPSLLHRLIKAAVHLWATSEEALSSCSFLVIRDVAIIFSSNCFDTCFTMSFKAFIARCKFVEPSIIKNIQFMRNSIVELCSLDLQKSYSKALESVQHIAKILQHGIQSKKKEAVEKICSWQYIWCIDLWVAFISANLHDNDLQSLLFTTIQVVNGVAHLFNGPGYLPLRLRCIQWLNCLSSSSGVFIPVAPLVLNVLEHKIGKDGGKSTDPLNLSTVIKLPKHLSKSRKLQEECILSAIELLASHFIQWSYHISFPEVASIPLINLKKFYETTTVESYRRSIKRLTDQVEQNIDFVQRKRDEAVFSPKDQQLVDSFLQLEKSSSNASFTQYYRSIVEKAASRNLAKNEKISLMEHKNSKKRKENGSVGSKEKINTEKVKENLVGRNENTTTKKQRT